MKKPRPRSALLLTCLPLLALMAPAGASAAVEVAPPGTEAGGAYTSAATTDDGCSSTNRVRFRQEDPLPPSFRVRHLGRMVCGVPTRIRCAASLTHLGE
ncbi:MAG TPA: hypothetical protein VGR10_02815, partial [Thermoleophilaceae bacterium]|nr:hypothetical protein [Thermoleophilaceae bacterium]